MDNIRLHPSEKELLLYVDGELRKRQARRIEQHLASCWQCRAQLAQTEEAIGEFVTLRRKLFDHQLHGADFPSGRTSRAVFKTHLAEVSGSVRGRGRKRIMQLFWPAGANRPLWTAGSLVATVLILLLIEPLVAPSVSAMEVIANTKAAELRRSPGTVLHQRIRIRKQAAASAAATVDCERWKNGGRSRILLANGHSDHADRLRTLYQARGADWENPLSAASFARLRESLGPANDEVRGHEQITVTSTPASAGTGELKRLELTVRRSDWHAISQRIELRDADYVLTELLDEDVSTDKVDPAIFAEPQKTTAAPVIRVPRRINPVPAAAPAGPTGEQLDSAEIRLREGLHQTWADVEEVPEIRREAGQIHVRLFAETDKRRQEIMAALAGVPYLVPEIAGADAEEPAAETRPPATPQPAPYLTVPPLAKALRDYSGGLDPANNYLNAVRDAHLQILVEASALARLADRYSDPEWNRLSAESQQRVNRIAADHVAEVRSNLRNYLRLLSPVLDEMAAKEHAEPEPPDPVEAPDSACAPWQSGTQPLLADLNSLQTAFRRLFVEERTEQPIIFSTTELLDQSLRSRARLRHRSLCQP
jgi:hypothetical protein